MGATDGSNLIRRILENPDAMKYLEAKRLTRNVERRMGFSPNLNSNASPTLKSALQEALVKGIKSYGPLLIEAGVKMAVKAAQQRTGRSR